MLISTGFNIVILARSNQYATNATVFIFHMVNTDKFTLHKQKLF